MLCVQRQALAMSAGIADAGSPLRLLNGMPELLKVVFSSLMPVKAPTLKSILDKAAPAAKNPVGNDEDDVGSMADDVQSEETICNCIRGFGAEPVDVEAHWNRKQIRFSQLHSLYRAQYPLELQINYVTTFEGYGKDFPMYILGVAGEQDTPDFSGERKLGGYDDGDCSGVDFCEPIGMFSAPEGAAGKIANAIAALRSHGMLPAEKTDKEMAKLRAKGLIIMPNIPYVAEVGWNVVGHSHVG
jgi:hypothetical protein